MIIQIVNGVSVPNLPWEDRPADSSEVVWRSQRNPIIPRNLLKDSNSMSAVLLDLDKPWKVIYRAAPYLLSPQMLYECVGDVPNVVFPCAALVDHDTQRMAIYYGAADTVTALAFTRVDELVQFVKDTAI